MSATAPLPSHISILGAGAWGTALALTLASRHQVVLWGRDQRLLDDITASRENTPYLPGFPLPQTLQLTADLDLALAHLAPTTPHHSLLITALPVAGLRPLTQQLRGKNIPNLVWLCKGLEEVTHALPHEIVRDELGNEIPMGALSGPSFAQEVAQGLPCALTIASSDEALRDLVVSAVHGHHIRVYSTDDVIGVEVGGAVKNILAIATGIIDGMGFGFNARAALITRGLTEITRLGVALGGRAETFTGLTGIGDLILTCTGDLSRNRRVGLGLAQGKTLDDVIREIGHVAEGVRCAQAVRCIAAQHQIEMPIADAVAAVLFDGQSPQEMVKSLLSRDPRRES